VRGEDWIGPTADQAFHHTLSQERPPPSSSSRLLDEWRGAWEPPAPRALSAHLATLPPSPYPASPKASSPLGHDTCSPQHFKLSPGTPSKATTHSISDNEPETTCPHCYEFCSSDHILFNCNHFWEPRGLIFTSSKSPHTMAENASSSFYTRLKPSSVHYLPAPIHRIDL
jgi:hypothetical protein